MRIAQLTPGTGSFHCGSCLRDHALVRALGGLGHEVLLVPLYLPLVLDVDERDEGDERRGPTNGRDGASSPLFFGGINVYLQQQSALFRHTPRVLDRLLDGASLLRWASRRAGMASASSVGALTVSMLRGAAGRQAKELSRLGGWLAEARPDVVCISNSMLLGLAEEAADRTGAAIVCSLQGEHAFLDGLPAPYREEAWALVRERARAVDAFLAPSRYYRDLMAERLHLDPERIHVVLNGAPLEGIAPAAAPPDPPVLGYLARMCPEKGLDRLVEAFIEVCRRGHVPGLRLRVAGAATRDDDAFVRAQVDALARAGLADRVEWLPNLDRAAKAAFLAGVTVLSVPALYGEAFGLYVVEALAAGVPVVEPRHGGLAELVEGLGGGVLYDPAAPGGLGEALEALLTDPERARALGLAGREAALRAYQPEAMARRVLEVLDLVRARRGPPPPLVELRGVARRFAAWSTGGGPASAPAVDAATDAGIEVLRGVDLALGAGEAVAVTGPSGSGKSTLLHILGLLDDPTRGALLWRGRAVAGLDERSRARRRAAEIGFVFQAHHLLPQLSALENVLVPALALEGGEGGDAGARQAALEAEARARRLLERVGLAARLHHLPGELSGGERQRVAVCRALVNRPALVLADEPTGSLDRAAAEALVDLLCELHREEGLALVVVTHADDVAKRFARVFELRDGVLRERGAPPEKPADRTSRGAPA